MRAKHPAALDDLQRRMDVKARWLEEELSLLARKEADLALRGDVKFVNLCLVEFFPHQTQESRKGVRRRKDYKEMVGRYTTELKSDPQPSTSRRAAPPPVLAARIQPSASQATAARHVILPLRHTSSSGSFQNRSHSPAE